MNYYLWGMKSTPFWPEVVACNFPNERPDMVIKIEIKLNYIPVNQKIFFNCPEMVHSLMYSYAECEGNGVYKKERMIKMQSYVRLIIGLRCGNLRPTSLVLVFQLQLCC